MTDEQIVNDIATKVMLWGKYSGAWVIAMPDGYGGCEPEPVGYSYERSVKLLSLGMQYFDPLHDANHTKLVRDKMREKGWTVVLVCHCGGCVSCYVTSSDKGICEGGDADNPGTAVCKAAAKAIVAESKIPAEKEIK